MILTKKQIFLAGFGILLFAFGCSKDDDLVRQNPDSQSINDLIKGLNYDPGSLLKVQPTDGGNSSRKETASSQKTTSPVNGRYTSCEEKRYSLAKNFDGISILRPTNSVIWPGALVYGNSDLLDGMPIPVTLSRAPMTLRIDLPGMREAGTLVIEKPNNASVQESLDNALEWWNSNAYEEGYYNPSLSDYATSVSYSSQQLGLDVGLNLEWVSGDLQSQLSYETSTQKEVAMLVFKQVFYTVTMNTPGSPAEVFSPTVTLNQAQAAFNDEMPPAYISSVSYGRIIMFRLERTRSSTSVDLEAVLNYAGGVSGSGSVNAAFDAVLRTSNITVVTIGGDAKVTSNAVNAVGPGSFRTILTGENAVYSRNNPGVPIGYTVQFLKDNRLAKMGYTTNYTVASCETKPFTHRDILVKNKFKVRNIRVQLTYLNSAGVRVTVPWNTIKDETFEGEYLDKVPAGAYDVRMNVEKFVLFDGWRHFTERNIGHVDRADEGCWVAYEKEGDEFFRKCVDEH